MTELSTKKGKTYWTSPAGNNEKKIGANCHVYTYEDEKGKKQSIMVDLGNMFVDKREGGYDQLIIDVGDRLRDVDALVLTHGHLDHVGAICHMVGMGRYVPPVCASRYTIAIVESSLINMGIPREEWPERKVLEPNGKMQIGNFKIKSFPVSHSIIGAMAFGIETPSTKVFHSGDYRLNPMGGVGHDTDLKQIKEYFNEGVDFAMMDTTSVTHKESPLTEGEVGIEFRKLLQRYEGKKIFFSHISNNNPRQLQVIEAAAREGYRVVFDGGAARAAWRNVLGVRKHDKAYDIPAIVEKRIGREPSIYDAAQLGDKSAGRHVYDVTGANGEPGAVLSRMAETGFYKEDQIDNNTVIIISQRPIPGNETKLANLTEKLEKFGATVVMAPHASGHASEIETRIMLETMKESKSAETLTIVPVHGGGDHREAMAALTGEVGLPHFHTEAGDCVELTSRAPEVVGHEQYRLLGVKNLSPTDPSRVSLDYDEVRLNGHKVEMIKELVAPSYRAVKGYAKGKQDEAEKKQERPQRYEGTKKNGGSQHKTRHERKMERKQERRDKRAEKVLRRERANGRARA